VRLASGTDAGGGTKLDCKQDNVPKRKLGSDLGGDCGESRDRRDHRLTLNRSLRGATAFFFHSAVRDFAPR
jgi:hypothetical protein